MIPETPTELVKGVRKFHGWSQADLAELLGVHVMTVSRWERGLPHQMSMSTKILLVILYNANPEVVAEAKEEALKLR